MLKVMPIKNRKNNPKLFNALIKSILFKILYSNNQFNITFRYDNDFELAISLLF